MCEVSDYYKKHEIEWIKHPSVVVGEVTNSRIFRDREYLVISYAKESDSGYYSCRLKLHPHIRSENSELFVEAGVS